MKAVVLVCELRGSAELTAQAFADSESALAVARRVRDTGKFNTMPVRAGMVLHSDKPLPILKFVAQAPVVETKKSKKGE